MCATLSAARAAATEARPFTRQALTLRSRLDNNDRTDPQTAWNKSWASVVRDVFRESVKLAYFDLLPCSYHVKGSCASLPGPGDYLACMACYRWLWGLVLLAPFHAHFSLAQFLSRLRRSRTGRSTTWCFIISRAPHFVEYFFHAHTTWLRGGKKTKPRDVRRFFEARQLPPLGNKVFGSWLLYDAEAKRLLNRTR